jgi:hypothetical protein
MLIVIYFLTRRLFAIHFEWGRLGRLVAVLAGIAVAGELLLPTSGAVGFVARGALWLLIFPLLAASGFLRAEEWRRVRLGVAWLRRRPA